VAELACNGNTPWLGFVLVLAIAAARGYELPTICLVQLDDVAHVHPCSLAGKFAGHNALGVIFEFFSQVESAP